MSAELAPPHAGDTSSNTEEADRVRLAASQSAPQSALQELASDPAVIVRAAVVMNQPVGSSLFQTLARDPDDRVRALLGRRLALLLPTLSAEDRAQLRDNAIATLMVLVNDETERVRLAIADAVKDMPGLPHDLIMRLAQDISIAVAEPVIRLSPILTDLDLLTLVSSPSGPSTVMAVARRPGLASVVASAIAATDNIAAIAALLANQTAAISEHTLDGLIERAVGHATWHSALVRRPRLSARASMALAEFVTGHVLQELAARTDLPSELAARLAQSMSLIHLGVDDNGPHIDPPNLDQAVTLVRSMAKAGQLTEDKLIATARRGEARLCTAILAATAGVPPEVVDRAARLRSAKGLVSLVWRAGFSMRAAGPIQTVLAKLPPDEVIHPTDHGDFPLNPDEMRWQVEFLMRIGRELPSFP